MLARLFLSTWASHKTLCALTTWGLASSRVNDIRDSANSCNAFYDLVLVSHLHDCHHILSVTKPAPSQCGRDHKDMKTRRQESLRAISEAGYHNTIQFFFHFPPWRSKYKFLAAVWIPSLNLYQVFIQPLPESFWAGVQGPPTLNTLSSDGTDVLCRLSQFLLYVRPSNTYQEQPCSTNRHWLSQHQTQCASSWGYSSEQDTVFASKELIFGLVSSLYSSRPTPPAMSKGPLVHLLYIWSQRNLFSFAKALLVANNREKNSDCFKKADKCEQELGW